MSLCFKIRNKKDWGCSNGVSANPVCGPGLYRSMKESVGGGVANYRKYYKAWNLKSYQNGALFYNSGIIPDHLKFFPNARINGIP